MNIDIVGAGALGLLFGGQLAAAGEKVSFWTRTHDQAALLSKDGFLLGSPAGEDKLIGPDSISVHCIESASSAVGKESADWVFITTKQRHIDDRLLNAVNKLLGKNTHIACFQNGIGHLEIVRAAFPNHPVFAVITTEGAKRINERKVVRAGFGVTNISTIPGDQMMESLIDSLAKAGFTAFLSNDIDKEIYRKLLINAVINPLTALWRIPNGELLANRERLEWMHQLCEEGLLVYRAYEIPFDPSMYEMIIGVCRSTAGNTSSMLKDVLEGAPTEADYINGRLVEMARSVKLSIPGHETIWRLVRAMDPSNGI